MNKSSAREDTPPIAHRDADRPPNQQDLYTLVLGFVLGLALIFLVSAYFA